MFSNIPPTDLRYAMAQTRLERVANELVAAPFRPFWKVKCETDGPVLDDEVVMLRPVRRVLTRSAARPTGYFASVKNDAVLAWESTLERDALRRLECDPTVSAYWTQPLTISYLDPWSRTRRHYTPDLFIRRGEQAVLAEVKARDKAKHPKTRRRLAYFRILFERVGVAYRVWDQTVIRREPELSNACWLLRYRGQPVSLAQRMAARRLLERHGPLPLSRVANHLGPDGRSAVYALLLRGGLRLLENGSLHDDPTVSLV